MTFSDTEGSLYAFDSWQDVYSRSYLIRGKYEQLGQRYYVPSKLIPSGKSDRVAAFITIRDASVDPDKVVFRTKGGTEFRNMRDEREKEKYRVHIIPTKQVEIAE